jgi:hypothetical protein
MNRMNPATAILRYILGQDFLRLQVFQNFRFHQDHDFRPAHPLNEHTTGPFYRLSFKQSGTMSHRIVQSSMSSDFGVLGHSKSSRSRPSWSLPLHVSWSLKFCHCYLNAMADLVDGTKRRGHCGRIYRPCSSSFWHQSGDKWNTVRSS